MMSFRNRVLSSLLASSSSKIDLTNANIVCDGNSLTQGLGSTGGNTYPNQLQALLNADGNNVSMTNIGVGGQTTDQMIADIQTQLSPLYVEGVQNILFAWEIRNDFTNNSPTPQEAYSDMITYLTIVKTLNGGNWYVITMTVMPSWKDSYKGDDTVTGYNLLDSDRLEANVLLKNNHTPADALIDIASVTGLSVLGDNEEANYTFNPNNRTGASANGNFVDGTHLSDQGYGLIALEGYNKLKSIAL